MAANALAAYPNHNKQLDIYTDSSDFQFGACIIQEKRRVAYFSRKLTNSQKNYTKMEKEMYSIVATSETQFLSIVTIPSQQCICARPVLWHSHLFP
jgi:hypothetical protein